MRRRFFWSMVAVAGLTLVVLFVLAAIVSQRAQVVAVEQGLRAVTSAVVDEIVDLQESDVQIRELAGGASLARVLEQARRSSESQIGLIVRTPRRTTITAPFIEDFGLGLDIEVGGVEVYRVVRGVAVARSVPFERLGGDVVVVAARQTPVIVWSEQVRPLLTGLVVAAVVAAVAARLLSGWVARRVDPLAEGAVRLSQGDLSTRVTVNGDDELTSVAVSFNEMAEALGASKDRERQFLLSVGHDLRTPLTTIGGYAEALEEGLEDPAEIARIAGVMAAEHRRLSRLIEDVMLLARLDSAEFGVVTESVDVAAHVEGVTSGYAERAAAAGIELVTNAEPTGLRVVDPDRVAQILSNLIENALRYTPSGGRVEVTLGSRPELVTIGVTDTGPGIDAGDLPHIFDRFYVAQRYRGVRPEGSGLGLSIVDRLASSMGGSVSATSPPGRGTAFVVSLPAPPA